LTVPSHLLPSPSSCGLDPIWSVYIKDDDIQVERPYTPLEGIDEHGHMLFWVKKYEKGEVGRWLHSKHAGDIVEIRGPVKTWIWQEDTWDEIIMVCCDPFPPTLFLYLEDIRRDGHHTLLSALEQRLQPKVF
jgi:cytochrome-b5 reductase